MLRLGELYALAINQLRSLEERVELERQLNHAEKMKAVGQLAGGIAHDFNNLLQGILGYTQFALQGLDEQHPVHADLLEVSNAAERAADLTSQMLAYSRRETVKRRHLDLDGLVDKSLKLLQRMLGEKVVLISGRLSDATVFADPGQLDQVLVNLAINAHDAMPEGGEIRVETEVVTLTEPQRREHPELQTERFVRLSIADEGVGISQEQRKHIFEPFFSTKEVGQGTGLGLATVYAIIEQHEGFLEVDSTPGRGTTFHTYLPLSDSPPDTPQPLPQPLPLPLPGQGLLLLVEDEDIVRDLNAMVLRQAGYDVIEARNGVEGIALAQEHKEDIFLAVLDVVMPHKGGVEVFNELRAENAEMPVIFSSGYSYSETEALPIDQPRCILLRKPYAPDDLLRAISSVLAPRMAMKKARG